MTKTTSQTIDIILNAALFVSIVFLTTLAYNFVQKKVAQWSVKVDAVAVFQVDDILKNGSQLNKVLVEQGAK